MPTTVNQSGRSASVSLEAAADGIPSPATTVFAMDWLISATGVRVISSESVRSRPRNSGNAERLRAAAASRRRTRSAAPCRARPSCPRSMHRPPPPPPPAARSSRRTPPRRRQRLDATDDVLDPPRLRVRCLVCRARQVEAHRHQRRGVEPDRGVLQVEEAADEQRRADQQHQRHRDFGDDEHVADAGAAAARGAAAALLQARLQVGAGRLQRRRQAEDDAGQHGHANGVGERAAVEAASE